VIERREFVRTSAALVTGLAAGRSMLGTADVHASSARSRADRQRADLLIRGGIVFDGGGGPGIEADVLLSGGRIARFARGITPPSGADVIDAAGLAVAPGFIDIHSHTDTGLFRFPEAHSKIRQGVTTEVAGQDGSSVAPSSPERAGRAREEYTRNGIAADLSTIAGFLTSIDTHGAAVNLATMVGAGTLRGLVIGNADRPATDDEVARMAGMVSEAIRGGACGLSRRSCWSGVRLRQAPSPFQ
jgi:N-acyl-D-amino-acid deacylase